MALILHLSDLHLLPPGTDEEVGDYKSGFVPPAHRQKRVDLLVDTLRGLSVHLTEEEAELDAIVISGDVTARGARAGLEMLPDFLSNLGDRLPDPNRIVVVPGNHDTAYGTAPSSLKRYKDFVKFVSDRGYVTPYLEGVDADTRVHHLVHDHFVICAVNSADYAGAVEPLDSDAKAQLAALKKMDEPPQALIEKLRSLRTVDAARINGVQLRRMAETLKDADPGHKRVRIVTFHHQIQPVSLNEELKAFESLSNLAEVQGALRDSEVDVVLHGHKHVPASLELSLSSPGNSRPHLCRAISVGSVGGMVGIDHEVAKLLRIEQPGPLTRTLAITSVPALGSGGRLNLPAAEPMVVASPASAPSHTHTVQGRTIADVHEQLMIRTFPNPVMGPLVCVVEEPSTGTPPPPTYPLDLPTGSAAGWFEGQVAWWQNHLVAQGRPFTHGDYIRRWHGVIDQYEEAIHLLKTSPHSSRAIVSLHDPGRAGRDDPLPSFSVLHLKLRNGRLEMLALFRKHEMRYWWAVNVAEIAMLQAQAVDRLTEPGREVTAGPITTVSAEAVFSEAMPKVAVPVFDQKAWYGSPEIATIAAAVLDTAMPRRAEVLSTAISWLEELAPPERLPSDGPYVSTAGPKELLKVLQALNSSYGSPRAGADLAERLTAFVAIQTTGQQFANGDVIDGYRAWADSSRGALDALISSVQGISAADA